MHNVIHSLVEYHIEYSAHTHTKNRTLATSDLFTREIVCLFQNVIVMD